MNTCINKLLLLLLFAFLFPENLKRTFINVASTSQNATCTATSAEPNFLCEKAIDDDLATQYKVKTGDNSVGSSINITFPHEYLISTVKITQLPGSSIQIERVKITFDNGSGVEEYVSHVEDSVSDPMILCANVLMS